MKKTNQEVDKKQYKSFEREAKVLFWDAECSPSLGYTYGQYQTNVIKVERPPVLLSFAWKWLGEKETHCLTLHDRPTVQQGDDSLLAKELWNILDQAEIVVNHNVRFDNKFANGLFLRHGMPPTSWYKTFCTLQTARRYFKLDNNKLDYLGQLLGVGQKTAITNHDVWYDCLIHNDEKAWKKLKKYNCLTPDHKVFTSDMRWKNIGDVVAGDKILAFDEHQNMNTKGRRMCFTNVESNRTVLEDVYAVTLSNGQVIKATKDHKWLCRANKKGSGGTKWLTTEQLVFRGRRLDGKLSTGGLESKTWISKYMHPSEEIMTKDVGWLAGMFDGEGSLSNRGSFNGYSVSISQKLGRELDKIGNILSSIGVNHSAQHHEKNRFVNTYVHSSEPIGY
mgnify:FL=1